MGEDSRVEKNNLHSWFRGLFDAQPDCVFHLDEKGDIIDVNHAACELLSYAYEELVGANLSLIVPRENLDDSYAKIAILRSEGAVAPYRKSFRTRDGRLIPFEIRITTTTDENGHLIIQSMARDLREQLETEQRLEESRQFVQALMQSTLDIIIIKDADGRMTMVNQAFLDLTGRSAEDFIGLLDADFLGYEQGQQVLLEDREVLVHGKTLRAENQFTLRSGKSVLIDYTKAPIKDSQGRIVGLLSIGRDTTTERSIAHQLIQAQKMEAVGAMAGEIAYDFNQLLSGVVADLLTAETKAQKGEPVLPHVQAALKASKTTMELTKRLLHLSKRQPTDFTPIGLSEVTNEIVTLLRSTIDRRVRIATTLDPNLWPIRANRGQIHQVLMNLCINARDALDERYGNNVDPTSAPWIEITLENVTIRPGWTIESSRCKPGDYVRVTVSDNGVGMPPEVMERVFEPFYSTKSREHGAGLGLSMVYAIVANHNGWVNVESEPGMGSDFILYLPRTEAEDAEKTDPDRTDGRRFPRILVIDDEIMVRGVMKTALLENGYQVYLAENGAKGWELMQRHKDEMDLIILDLIMPEMSGKHFVELLQKEGHRVPVLICTGYPGDMVIDDLRQLGVSEYLGKPFTPQQLLDKVQEIMVKNPPRPPAPPVSPAAGGLPT